MSTTIVGIGDIRLENDPVNLETTVGTCVSIVLHSRIKGITSMSHFIYSKMREYDHRRVKKFVETGLPLQINEFFKKAPRVDYFCGLYGGYNCVMTNNFKYHPGLPNVTAAREILNAHGIPIHEEVVLGSGSLKIRYSHGKTFACTLEHGLDRTKYECSPLE